MAGIMRSCNMSRKRNNNEDALGVDWRDWNEVDEETEKDFMAKKIMWINLTELMRIFFMYL